MTALPPATRRHVLVLVTVGVVLAACGPDPSPPTPEPAAFDGRLLVHTGRPEADQLFALDGRGGEAPVEPPAGGLRWFAAEPAGRLAGVGGDGTIVVAQEPGAPWLPTSTDEVPAEAREADVRLPAWSPDGRLGVLFGDSGAATLFGVLVVDPATGGGLWVPLEAGLGGYPPAWIDASRLAVPSRDSQDRPTLTILEIDSGAAELAGRSARALAASPDGSTVAVLLPDSRTIELWRPAAWLGASDGTPLGRVVARDGDVIEALALDRLGDRLALGTSGSDGTTGGGVAIHDGSDGWSVSLERPMEAGARIGALGFVP
jgi:hypothetical protein